MHYKSMFIKSPRGFRESINAFRKFFYQRSQEIMIMIYILIALSLGSAYVIEYGFGVRPCDLCLYQRYVYFFLLFLFCLFLLARKFDGNSNGNLDRWTKICIFLTQIALLLEFAIALFNFGLEEHWFVVNMSCTSAMSHNSVLSLESFRNALMNEVSPSCDKATMKILSLSLAGWNAIFSFFLSSLNLFVIFCRYKKVNRGSRLSVIFDKKDTSK